MRVSVICCMIVLLSACSDGSESEVEGHMWKDQTDMLDKAKGVEDLLGEANAAHHQRIEEQTQ